MLSNTFFDREMLKLENRHWTERRTVVERTQKRHKERVRSKGLINKIETNERRLVKGSTGVNEFSKRMKKEREWKDAEERPSSTSFKLVAEHLLRELCRKQRETVMSSGSTPRPPS